MAKAATAHPRRSKADVQQEFRRIREEVAATRDARNAKVEEAARLEEAEVRQAVDVLSVEGVARSVSALSIQVSKALAEVSGDLIAEVTVGGSDRRKKEHSDRGGKDASPLTPVRRFVGQNAIVAPLRACWIGSI